MSVTEPRARSSSPCDTGLASVEGSCLSFFMFVLIVLVLFSTAKKELNSYRMENWSLQIDFDSQGYPSTYKPLALLSTGSSTNCVNP